MLSVLNVDTINTPLDRRLPTTARGVMFIYVDIPNVGVLMHLSCNFTITGKRKSQNNNPRTYVGYTYKGYRKY